MPTSKCVALMFTILLSARVPLAYPAERSSPGKQVELHWGELASFIVGGRITTVLPDSAVLRGRALAVDDNALVLDVSKSTAKQAYPKGRTSIPRDHITTLSLKEVKGANGRVALTLAGTLGALARVY